MTDQNTRRSDIAELIKEARQRSGVVDNYDGKNYLIRRLSDALERLSALPKPSEAIWNDMADAPKDGTMLRLLVRPSAAEEDGWTPFSDSMEPYETIGFNSFEDTTEDRWQFAGWDWNHDCFTEGAGDVIGWQPFVAPPAQVEVTDEIGDPNNWDIETTADNIAREVAAIKGGRIHADWYAMAKQGALAALRIAKAAALTATDAKPVPAEPVAGWKLVPIKPTTEMLKAAGECFSRYRDTRKGGACGPDYYRAMVAAAPNVLTFQYCDGCDGYNCDAEKGCAYPNVPVPPSLVDRADDVAKFDAATEAELLAGIDAKPVPAKPLAWCVINEQGAVLGREISPDRADVEWADEDGWTDEDGAGAYRIIPLYPAPPSPVEGDVERLRAALKPFASAWDRALSVGKTATLAEFGAIAGHHVGAVDFRRAHAALASEGKTDA